MTTQRLLTALAMLCSIASALVDCDDVLRDASVFAGRCSNKWRNLKPLVRPTQKQVGFAWVNKKLRDSYSSKGDAQDSLDETPIPAVLGPSANGSEGAIFIIDHHHELAALDYAGFEDASVTVHVLCDQRRLSEAQFWRFMQSQNKAFLLAHPGDKPNALPVSIDPAEIPAYFEFTEEVRVFSDDPWRSLASFSRKVKVDACEERGLDKYCERCYIRLCDENGGGIPFFEFQWAYFFNEAFLDADAWWPSAEQSAVFKQLYYQLPFGELAADEDDDGDLELWEASAEALIPLCRAESTGQYLLPGDKFSTTGTRSDEQEKPLPGYVEGHKPLPKDPECESSSCFATFAS